jgi:hypothetical protein
VRKVTQAVLVNLMCSKSGGGSSLCRPYGNNAMPNPNGVESGASPVQTAPPGASRGTKPSNGGGGGECGGGT